MFKKPITYEDFDGRTVTEDFYFNLSKTELMLLEAETPGGLGASLERIAATKDYNKIVQEFRRIVLASYGVRSEDGRRFIKTEQLREEFQQMPAWDSLFFELATKADAATEFITAVFPKELDRLLNEITVEQLASQAPQVDPMMQNPSGSPVPPGTPGAIVPGHPLPPLPAE